MRHCTKLISFVLLPLLVSRCASHNDRTNSYKIIRHHRQSLSVLPTSSLSVRGGVSTIDVVQDKDSIRKTSEKAFCVSNISSIWHSIAGIGAGIGAGIAAYIFSLYFPFMLTPRAAKAIYVPAHYSYDPSQSYFCNSPWTYATDYAVMAVTVYLAKLNLEKTSSSILATRLKRRAAAVMAVYALQFAAGGLAHQFFTTLESRSTLVFRVLWSVVVMSVCASGGFIGACGSEIAKSVGVFNPSDAFWFGYGGIITSIGASGLMSHQRPAVDTFIAGITQSPPTFWLVGIVFTMLAKKLSLANRMRCSLGFGMNALLLPGYALVLYYTDTPIPVVNVVLHSWLMVCYSLQGLSLYKLVQVVEGSNSICKGD